MYKMVKNISSKRFSAIFLLLAVCFIVSIIPQVSAFDWNDDIISYYDFDETTGVIAFDSTGNNDADNIGATINQDGILERSYEYVSNSGDNVNTTFVPSGLNFSFQVWVNTTSSAGSNAWRIMDSTSGNDGAYLVYTTFDGGVIQFNKGTGSAQDFVRTTYKLSDHLNEWTHIVATFDGTNMTVYVNGVSNISEVKSTPISWGSQDLIIGNRPSVDRGFPGRIDEVGIWDRALTPTDVLELYNSGSGVSFSGSIITINLDSPENDTIISDIGANFTVSGDVSEFFNTTNITYFIWNNDSSIHNQTTVVLDSNQTFNETLFIDEFTLGDFIWNAEVCFENSTFNNCSFAENNFTFSVVPFSVLEEEFSPNVLEGDTSNFNINISVITFDRLTNIIFVYNGTEHSSTFTEYEEDKWFATIDKTIPQVNGTTILPFYWSVSLESGFIQNSTTQNQTILEISIDDCSTFTNQIFNFTIVDEATQIKIDGASGNTSLKVDMILSFLDDSEEIIQFSKEYSKVNPARICMNHSIGNSSLRMDAVIEYTASDKFVEFYNIQNFIFDNSTKSQNITLFNLAEDEGQEFKITYKGQDFIAVTDLIVQIQRKYIEEGVFKTIEIPMSGTNGFTIAHLVANDVIYNLFFIKDGVLLDSFTEVIANCQNPLITECEINLNALITGTDLFDIITEDDFFSSLTYDKDTRVVSSTFGIISGVSGVVQLNVTLIDNFGNTSVCSDSLNAAGGTLTCTVPASFGNSTIYATISFNDDVRREGYILLKENPKDQYGGVLIFSSIILLLFMFGMGVSDNPLITGVFLILGVFLLVGLNLAYSTSIVGAGATILWFVVSVVVVIIKGSGKR